MPGVLQALNDRSIGASALKIEALSFLKRLLESNPPSVFQPHVATLSKAVFAAAGERWVRHAALCCGEAGLVDRGRV